MSESGLVAVLAAAVALTGGSLTMLSATVEPVERWLRSRAPEGVSIERLFASVEDLRGVYPISGVEG